MRHARSQDCEFVWSPEMVERTLFGSNGGHHKQRSFDRRALADFRESPRYSVQEVALYLNLRPRTVHTWFFGRSYHTKAGAVRWQPLAAPAAHDPHGFSLSFFNLAEAHVISATRHGFNIPITKIRGAIEFVARNELTRHPLLTRKFETDGVDLFIRYLSGHGEEKILNLSKPGQLGLREVLNSYLQRIDRDLSGLPLKIFPVVKQDLQGRPIVIISGVASGRPTIAGTGVRVATVWDRSRAGETPQELASDYGVDEETIKKAISYFSDVRAA